MPFLQGLLIGVGCGLVNAIPFWILYGRYRELHRRVKSIESIIGLVVDVMRIQAGLGGKDEEAPRPTIQ